jgi:acyl-coenzyme A thioesterase 13
MICELNVDEDMTNLGGTLHGGCASYLIDGTTSLILVAHSMMTTGAPTARVSQQMNVTFHAPASLGVKLKIVCYTISVGNRTATAACEIWDATNNRLAVSGSQIMMQASLPGAPKPKL